MCTIPHILVVIEDYKDLIPVIITFENKYGFESKFSKKRMTHIAGLTSSV
ncbi:hypothetical protein Hanom_Chr14g01280101 [Helianthus anomalus]